MRQMLQSIAVSQDVDSAVTITQSLTSNVKCVP